MHRMLLRQLNRFFGPADAVPAHLRNFINAVDEAYEQNDAEQKHLQHSYEQAAKDLAERNRQVNLRSRELEMLKQCAVDGIIICDFEARIIDANPAAQAALGRTIHELRGQVIYETIVPDAHRDAHSQLISRHLSGHETGVSRIETRCIRPATGEFPVEMAITVVRGEGPSQIIVCFRDTSGRKGGTSAAAPAAPPPAPVSIPPDLITRIASQLHEPLNEMTHSLEMLEETSLNGQQRHYAGTLRNATDSINTLLSRMLEHVANNTGGAPESEIESESEPVDAGDVTDFDLGRVVEEMVETLAPQAGQKGLEFAYSVNPDVPTAVVGDPARFRQVLINLVSNAIKFTDHGEVVVQVTASEQSNSHVTVRCAVKDSGRGIPQEQVERLYKAFSQPSSNWSQSGKGLAISRQLVTSMGGTIGMESQPGQGSTFWFTAKLRKQQVISDRDTDGPMIRPTDGIRVLVVDDNVTNCNVMKEQLEGWGMSVQAAPGGSEALKILLDGVVANKPFDVAVIDYEMPGMDGIELGRTIRAIPTFRRIPMVLLRPSTSMVNDMMMKEGGFSLCLVKPLRPTQLKDAIENSMSAPAVAGNSGGGGGGYGQEQSHRQEQREEREAAPPPPPGPMKLDMVIQRCMGDMQYLERILYQFQEQSNETLDRITERLNARDGKGAANLASALRGAAEYMGADDLREHAAHIEELAMASLLNESLKAMGALREEVFRCIDYIPELLHQAATSKEMA